MRRQKKLAGGPSLKNLNIDRCCVSFIAFLLHLGEVKALNMCVSMSQNHTVKQQGTLRWQRKTEEQGVSER